MAAHAVHHPKSGRFVKAYLLTWGLMATGALAYLGSLAWQPELLATPPPTQVSQAAEPDPVLATATKALAEIGTVQRSVGEIQRDVRQLKETVEQHETQGKTVQSRLAVLEERATAPEVPVAAAAPVPTINSKAADKAKAKAHLKTAEPRQLARVVTTIETAKPGPIAEAAQPAPIETGSIAQAPIVFGDAVVTAAPNSVVTSTALAPPAPATPSRYAVQLAAGPSLDALRLQWSLLAERHGAALASLTPQYVPPRNPGGPYRLVAGPLPNKAEADKVCAEMGVGTKGCLSIQFAGGEPL
jgi:hypothetical protein